MKNKWVAVIPEKCVGCRICELVCSLTKEGIVNPKIARIKVLTRSEFGISLPLTCHQCEDPPCAKNCPRNAIVLKERTGAYIVDRWDCIGCGLCVTSCPFGMIFYKDDKQVIKCDLCGGDPVCVKYCPVKAIQYISPKELPRIWYKKISA